MSSPSGRFADFATIVARRVGIQWFFGRGTVGTGFALWHYMHEQAEKLRARTAAFAKAVIQLCDRVGQGHATRTITAQLIDAATSVSSNYRAACRARSHREFVAKIGLVREEADEAHGWLMLLVDLKTLNEQDARAAINEANELTAIFNSSFNTARRRLDYTAGSARKR